MTKYYVGTEDVVDGTLQQDDCAPVVVKGSPVDSVSDLTSATYATTGLTVVINAVAGKAIMIGCEPGSATEDAGGNVGCFGAGTSSDMDVHLRLKRGGTSIAAWHIDNISSAGDNTFACGAINYIDENPPVTGSTTYTLEYKTGNALRVENVRMYAFQIK